MPPLLPIVLVLILLAPFGGAGPGGGARPPSSPGDPMPMAERGPREWQAAASPVAAASGPGPSAAAGGAVPVPRAAVVGAVPSAVALYGWPVVPPRVVRRFDPPPEPWLAGHRGVDLAAGAGVVVRASGDGVVTFAGEVAGKGVVSVTHVGGLRTTYEPVTATVALGDRVARGEPIGVLEPGHAGCPAEACLHWGLRRGNLYLDPLVLVGLGHVRLLPLDTSAGRPVR
jgi:murein DD-endopeptidase MepM/ murein hydrolase activator NlpD